MMQERDRDTTVILLAGGVGSRMGTEIPKQYLLLNNKPLAMHSFEVFCKHPRVQEIIVVCDPSYRLMFTSGFSNISFALPGARRQDSLENGFQAIKSPSTLICVHDAARPMIDETLVTRVLEAAEQHGAATVGMPVKFTLKQSQPNGFVRQTLDRSEIWEIQTPQVLRSDLMRRGLEKARNDKIDVTDDVALAELVGAPVKLVQGSSHNLKITTPNDLDFAEFMLNKHGRTECKI